MTCSLGAPLGSSVCDLRPSSSDEGTGGGGGLLTGSSQPYGQCCWPGTGVGHVLWHLQSKTSGSGQRTTKYMYPNGLLYTYKYSGHILLKTMKRNLMSYTNPHPALARLISGTCPLPIAPPPPPYWNVYIPVIHILQHRSVRLHSRHTISITVSIPTIHLR